MTITYTTYEGIQTEELTIRHDGARYEWFIGDDDTVRYTTNNNGDGIFLVDSAANERKQLVGHCDWHICQTDKATRAKIKRWTEKVLGDVTD